MFSCNTSVSICQLSSSSPAHLMKNFEEASCSKRGLNEASHCVKIKAATGETCVDTWKKNPSSSVSAALMKSVALHLLNMSLAKILVHLNTTLLLLLLLLKDTFRPQGRRAPSLWPPKATKQQDERPVHYSLLFAVMPLHCHLSFWESQYRTKWACSFIWTFVQDMVAKGKGGTES